MKHNEWFLLKNVSIELLTSFALDWDLMRSVTVPRTPSSEFVTNVWSFKCDRISSTAECSRDSTSLETKKQVLLYWMVDFEFFYFYFIKICSTAIQNQLKWIQFEANILEPKKTGKSKKTRERHWGRHRGRPTMKTNWKGTHNNF